MKHLLITLLFLGSFVQAQDSTNAVVNYNRILHNIKQRRELIKSNKIAASRALQASQLLYKSLGDSVFPAWYDTKWDFNGHTNVPKQGVIACGYFVSTTLKHAGFNLNRYKTAQQAAAVIINKICGKKQVKTYYDSASLISLLAKSPEALYLLGLDYHVGFLLVEKGEVYFVHSDFINGKVVRELASESAAFNSSVLYVLGELTNNASLMNNWLKGVRLYG